MTIDIEQLRKDMEAGTQGDWDNKGTHRNQTDFGVFANGGRSICSTGGYQSGQETDHPQNKANARRIARLPDLEQAYLDLHEQNRKLREALRECVLEMGVCRVFVNSRQMTKQPEGAEIYEQVLKVLDAARAALAEREAE